MVAAQLPTGLFQPFAKKMIRRLIFLGLLALSTKLSAAEFTAGVGALEEGDDRGRAAAVVQSVFSNNWWTKLYIWGRSYGPVSERSGIFVAGKRFDLFGSKDLRSSIGFSSLAEHTAIDYKDAPSESSSFTSTNFGVMFGVSYDVFKTKNITISTNWDSHIFAAGQAILLLVTGRKQIISITAGITL